jgi:hypothetical protein
MIQCLILGAGPKSAQSPSGPAGTDGPELPLWLAERDGEVLVQRLIQSCSGLQARLVFAVRSDDVKRYHIDSIISLAAPGAVVVPVRGETRGAACTALLCVRHLDPEAELLILNANEFLEIDYAAAVSDFRARGLDAGVVVFPSLHPRYSCVRLDDQGLIVQAAEKHPISSHAIAGFYWFRRAASFLEAAQSMIRKDVQVDGVFFISLALNELVLKNQKLGVIEVDRRCYQPLKTTRQLASYEAGLPPDIAA